MAPKATAQHSNTPRRVSARTVDDLLSPVVEDEVATGTKSILNSSHISEGPGRIANAPVPSVFVSDLRRFPCSTQMKMTPHMQF